MIIAIVNQKGGTGKTTTTVNLGSALAKMGKKVLLIDLDPQGNLSYSLGIEEPRHFLDEVLLGEIGLSDILVEREGMKIAPSRVELADVELTIAMMKRRESILKSKLKGLDKYEFVLIDCPPSLSLLTVNALNAANEIIIPLQMEVLSLQGLDQILTTVGKMQGVFNKSLAISGILPVMVDNRRKLSSEVLDYIEENYDLPIFNSRIRTNVRASEAPSFGKSAVKYAPSSNSAKDYMAFANEIVNGHYN